MNEKCFGLRAKRECAILENKVCHGCYDTCPFYKPKWMAERDNQRSLARIAAKPWEEQQRISEKYFQGKMPWAKEEL